MNLHLVIIAQAIGISIRGSGVGTGGKFLHIAQAVRIKIPGRIGNQGIKSVCFLPDIGKRISIRIISYWTGCIHFNNGNPTAPVFILLIGCNYPRNGLTR